MTTHNAYDVIGVGLVAVDCLWLTPEKLVRGEKHEVADMVLQGGAPAGSTSAQLGRLGYRTGFLACLGDDTLSGIARQEFRANGVDDGLFQGYADASPALALCEVDHRSAERTVYYNLSRYRHLQPADLPLETLRAARVLILDSFEIDAVETILNGVKGSPVRTVLDLEHGSSEQLKRCIALGTDVILPWVSVRALTGQKDPESALREIAAWTPAQVVATDGMRGSWALSPEGELLHQAAFDAPAVDTTGCGDAYHGGYAVGLLEGWPLAVRMEYGSWVAAQVVQKLGGRTGLPTAQNLGQHDFSAMSAPTRAAVEKLVRYGVTITASLPLTER